MIRFDRAASSRLAGLWLALLSLALVRCGGEPAPDAPIEQELEINQIAESLTDMAGVPEEFATKFADASKPTPEELARYAEYEYNAQDDVRVSGTTATMTVIIFDAESLENLGNFTWTFVEENETWKIQDAPLP